MKDLSKLEKAIYERELKSLTAEISKGIEIIRNAFKPYNNASSYGPEGTISVDSEKNIRNFNEWLLSVGGSYYYGGYHLSINQQNVANAPEFIKLAILDVAVKKFLSQVEFVEEISGKVQSLEHHVTAQ